LLRDAIDQEGGDNRFRRAIIIGSSKWRSETTLQSQATISVGGAGANATTKEIVELAESKGKKKWGSNDSFGIFVQDGTPRVALWGNKSAQGTRASVEHYIQSPDGLKALLAMVWT
jgi:hypothetical protein